MSGSITADYVDRLLEGLFYACYDWIVEGREPELDRGLVARRTRQRLAGMARAIRAEIERRGLSPQEVDARLGWKPGRLEEVLANPSELSTAELDLLVRMLQLPVERLFQLDKLQTKETEDTQASPRGGNTNVPSGE